MPVTCGFAKQVHPDAPTHETVAQAALCSRRYYAERDAEDLSAAARWEAQSERAAEDANERFFEDRGSDEERFQEQMEARQGVIPFDEALRNAAGEMERQSTLGRVSGVKDLPSALVDTTPAGPSRQERRHLGRYRRPFDGPRPKFLDKAHLATIPVHDRDHTGHYAVRNGEAVELYQVERPTEGEHAGSTFVRPYGERANLKGAERRRVFAAILADPLGAAALFGQRTGKCGVCHHGLRVQESLKRVVIVDGREITGVGPKCAKKFRRVTT